jgi:hypothetical protein
MIGSCRLNPFFFVAHASGMGITAGRYIHKALCRELVLGRSYVKAQKNRAEKRA